jgi:Ca2+-binding EF-hand superfamily protein
VSLFLPALLGLACVSSPIDGVDILLPDGQNQVRMRVEVKCDGPSPEASWESFLDKLFDHFDRDGDGFLSPVEAGRIFPLPLPNGREAGMDFARLDLNRDGRASREEFKTYYRTIGFAPVVVAIRPGEKSDPGWIEHHKLGPALFRNLDRRGEGRLTRIDLENARLLLKSLDENEDELLTPSELLALEPAGLGNVESSQVKGGPIAAGLRPDAILRLLADKPDRKPVLDSQNQSIRVTSESGSTLVFAVPDGQVTVTSTRDAREGFRAAKGFYLAQFKAFAGSKPSLGRAELEAERSLAVLCDMFSAADRNGDGKLTLAELGAFLDLVELGFGCQVVVAVEDRGRNLFDMLDLNHDGVLDLAELNLAAKTCERHSRFPLAPSSIPRQFFVSATRGQPGPSFGPVPLPSIGKTKGFAKANPPRGPKWFQAMDRNGDGYLSPMEFIGPPELFRKLDTNGDGRISVEEAEAASPK